ncbi:hypothetical protein ACFFGH_12195 [Lysobacter korlensis]|uniref:DUF4386 family protein n=1 Tax=Lysobacter korlensis TaxID=553636 RepID=A0ABV6RP70_9GAMM
MTTPLRSPLPVSSASDSAGPVRDERRLLFSGVLFGVANLAGLIFIVAFMATTHPPMDATPVEAAIGFRDAGLMVGIGTFLAMLGLPLGLLFLGGLGSVLRRTGDGPLVGAAVSAGIASFLIPAMGSLVSAISPAIGAADTSAAAGAVVKAIDGVMPMSVALGGFPRAVLLLAVVVLLARVGLAGRGLKVSGYAIAVLGLVGTGTFILQPLFGIASISSLLFAGWVTVLALVLRRRTAAPAISRA